MSLHPKTTYLRDYRVPNYLTQTTTLTFELFDDYTLVTSQLAVIHNPESTSQSKDLTLFGEDLILETISMNDKVLQSNEYQLSPTHLIIPNAPSIINLVIKTKIFPQKNTSLNGLYLSNNNYSTQCEAQGFRRITYYQDQPDILSRFTTKIIADEKCFPVLLSNGNLVEKGKLAEGRHFATWNDPYKKPSYLFALVAGDFDLLADRYTTQSGREVALKIYVEKGYKDQAQHAMHSVKRAMKWDEQTYGREYDLDIYMIVAISDFNMGAMENKGLNIFNTKYILAKPETATDDDYIHILSVIGHEYFHNWSGNRVTCRDWFQLSLKEGLTIFRDQSFTEDELSKGVMRIRDVNYLRESQFPEDASPLAHPVRPESYIEINNFYTSTVYNKGAEVLRMLQTMLGKFVFRQAMDLYFARYDGQAVTIDDYINTMEEVSGYDLTQFRLWYSQAGTPVVTVMDEYDAKNQEYLLNFSQRCPPTPGQEEKKPLTIPILMALFDHEKHQLALHLEKEESTKEKLLILTETTQTFKFKNISTKPIPSLMRHFSAPIKLEYTYSLIELAYLFKNDTDLFNRWEAGQKFALCILLELIKNYQVNHALALSPLVIETYKDILHQDHKDKLYLAEALLLPSERYIGQQMEIVDVDAIHYAREFFIVTLARELKSLFLKQYKENAANISDEFNTEAIGKRYLKNQCLAYLLKLTEFTELGITQFKHSLTKNMTDTITAFKGLINLDTPQRANVLEQFYQTWNQDDLVVDKWLLIQATCQLKTTLGQVKQLMHHPAFDIKNPNKVYSLIGGFSNNVINFHAKTGEGYAFLQEAVHQLDKLNPQVASRMVKPLTSWKRYDKERQKLMREQLEKLLKEQPSRDLYEIVSKSL